MVKEVRIKLTAEQKAKIKAGTGKVMNEIRVGSLGNSLAVTSAKSVSSRLARETMARVARAAPARVSARLARAIDSRVARSLTQRAIRKSDNQD